MKYPLPRATARLGLIFTVAVTLLSCGGGGGGGGGSSFLPDAGGRAYALAIELTDAQGNATTVATPTSPATLSIVATNDGQPAEGIIITASSSFAALDPSNGQARTDADGRATFQLAPADQFGADIIEITAGRTTRSITLELRAAGLRLGSFEDGQFLDGQLGVPERALATGGTTLVRVTLVDENGVKPDEENTLRFSSSCAAEGRAGFRIAGSADPAVTSLLVETVDSEATAEYVAGRCAEQDQLRVELVGDTTVSAAGTVIIAPPTASYIGFYCAEPREGQEVQGGGELATARTIIAPNTVAGAPGGRPDRAIITFEVLAAPPQGLPDGGGLTGPELPCRAGSLPSDPSRNPLSGVPVSFELSNDTGGIRLDTGSMDRDQDGRLVALTDDNGLVSVEVLSGSVPTTTSVIASFEAQTSVGAARQIATTSNQIVVSTGLPAQNGLSLSVERFLVPGAANVDGVDNLITARLVDRFSNPVPDGTAVQFRTEYGAIDNSCVTGISNGARVEEAIPARGTCSVLWTSQAPRFPTFNRNLVVTTRDVGYDCSAHNGRSGPCPDDLGPIRGGRSTILAYALGEETFVDRNGNGLYDPGEPFDNLTEAFIDHNEDGVYTPVQGPNCSPAFDTQRCAAAGFEEEFIDRDGDGQFSLNLDPATGRELYNGTLCTEQDANVGNCSRDLVQVRADTVITLSPTDGNVQAILVDPRSRTVETVATEGEARVVYLADIFNSPPGAGTVITLETAGDCEVIGQTEFVLSDSGSIAGARAISFQVDGDGEPGQVAVLSQSEEAGSATQVASYACSTSPPPEDSDSSDPDFSPQPGG